MFDVKRFAVSLLSAVVVLSWVEAIEGWELADEDGDIGIGWRGVGSA